MQADIDAPADTTAPNSDGEPLWQETAVATIGMSIAVVFAGCVAVIMYLA